MKKNRILTLAAALAIFGSCTKDEVINTSNEQAAFDGVTASGAAHVCLDMSSLLTDVSTGEKALVKAKLWENGQTIKVKFLSGSTSLQNRIMEKARIWEQYANLKFEVVTSGDADIRISINGDGSSWSYLGIDAKRINQNNPTMNFGWFSDNSSENEIQRTTLHEFGHALGAIHEHSSPDADIQWDVDAVYEQYARYGWSKEQVDNNLFFKYSSNLITNSEYDPDSIMHYPINNNLTLNNFSVGYNTELSDLDKEFIGITYPFGTTNPNPDEPDTPTTNSGDNVALGRTTSQSSTAYSGISSRAVDGNTSGVWRNSSVTHTATTNQPWWKVDLDATTSIDKVIIYNRTDNCCVSRLSNFYVEALSETGSVVGSLYISNPPTPTLTINGNGINAKSIRIRLAGTNPLSLAEVQVIQK